MPTIHMSYADATQVVYALRELDAKAWEVLPESVRDMADEFRDSIHDAWLRDDGDVRLKVTAKDAGTIMSALAAEVLRKRKWSIRVGQEIHSTARIMRELSAKLDS